MSRVRQGSVWLVAAAVAWSGIAGAQAKDGAIAKVGRLNVAEAEFTRRVETAVASYEQRTGQPVPDAFEPMLRRHVLEGLIRANLLMLEAERRGLLVSDAEAEEALKQNPYFNEGGSFNEARFEAVRVSNPEAFKAGLSETRLQLSGTRLSQQLERERSPEGAALRHEIERELTSVNMEALMLPYGEFSGEYAEPTEREVLDHYRSHPEDFMRPAHAVITVLGIEASPLPDSLREMPAAVRARDQELRQRADSALAAAGSGVPLEDLSGYGRIYSRVEVKRENFPGFWKGDGRDQAAVFSHKAGELLDAPVRGRDGWLVVQVNEASQDEPAPLVDVAPQIRDTLRVQKKHQADEPTMRAIYKQLGDSLQTIASHVRYATFRADETTAKPPSSADIGRYYRSHLADYSTFDAGRGEVNARPLSEVRDEVARRLMAEEQLRNARSAGEKLFETWSRGRRDPKREALGHVVEVGPIPVRTIIGASGIELALSDTLAARNGAEGVGTILASEGMVVYQLYDRVEDYRVTYEQALPFLTMRLAQTHENQLVADALQLFEADPEAFAADDVIHFSRLMVPMLDILSVQMSREEVNKWYREHIDLYSAPEVVAARHILIVPAGPGPGPDQAARIKGDGILRRIRAGEAFESLAREFSDDLATREQGGDLGSFGRGVMLPDFERAVFAMREGDVSDLVRTPLGYHIIKCTAYEAMLAPPLPTVYANVSADVAKEKVITLTHWRADSLLREIDSIEEAIAMGASGSDVGLLRNQRIRGRGFSSDEMVRYFQILDQLKPGEFYPGVQQVKGQGFVITWVDSITPPREPEWSSVRDEVIGEVRRQRARSALNTKLLELRRMSSQGWSLDSLAALFGGLSRFEESRVGDGLPNLGGVAVMDSLMFGTASAPAMKAGTETDWVEFPGGFARIRLEARLSPPEAQLAARVERERRRELERRLFSYYEELKKRHDVQIFDRELRSLSLPPPPPREQAAN